MLLLLSGSVRQQQLRETKTKLIPMGVNVMGFFPMGINVMGFSPMGINTEAFDCVYIANDNHTSLEVKQNDEILIIIRAVYLCNGKFCQKTLWCSCNASWCS